MNSDAPSDGWVAPVVPLFGSGRGGAGASPPAPPPRSDAAPAAPPPVSAAEPPEARKRGEKAAAERWTGARDAVEEQATASSATARYARSDDSTDGPSRRQQAAEKAAEKAERRARNVSVAALARRGMSVAELRDRLAERGIEPDEVEAELERLQSARYLDDAALADSVIRTETERKGRGRSAVAAELRRRRVDGAAIEAALETLDDEGERERAVAVAVHRARQLRGYDAETARRRLYGFLQRRGFSGSVLQHAVDTALASTD